MAAEGDRRTRAEAESVLGNIDFEQDQAAQAEQHYRTAARLFEAVRDTSAVAAQLAAVGQMLLAQGQVADAVEVLRAASDRVPNDLTVQTELGWALWSMGQHRAAVAVLTDALAIDGGDTEALRVRGASPARTRRSKGHSKTRRETAPCCSMPGRP